MTNLSRLMTSIAVVAFAVIPAFSATSDSAGLQTDRTVSLAPIQDFIPIPSSEVRINYEAWDALLADMILFMGPSSRQTFEAPPRETGSRISRTHNSPFRMEGNKILYPFMGEEILQAIGDYVNELERVGTTYDIRTLSRNEQLAYWINLHNAIILREVGQNYPGPNRRPEKIKPIKGSDTLLNDAKLVTVSGTLLSLHDIRERIVFPNWDNPDVAFAFHMGDASSPSFANVAYMPSQLAGQLKINADEYVNSLRGVDDGKVSRYFHDIAPWYFSDFENDLGAYFRKRMRADVYANYLESGYRGVNRYDNVVSDITAGYGKRGRQRIALSTDLNSFALGKDVQQFLVQRAKKIEQLRKEDWFKRGVVTIEDIETDDGIPNEIE